MTRLDQQQLSSVFLKLLLRTDQIATKLILNTDVTVVADWYWYTGNVDKTRRGQGECDRENVPWNYGG
jgi:hypothetical protein